MSDRQNTPLIQHPVRDRFESRYQPGDDDRNFVTTLARGLDVVRAFQSCSGPLGNSEIAAITGLPKPTVSRMTYTLCQLGYLVQEKGRKYQLSVALLALAYPVLSGLRIRQQAHDRMSELARLTQCTIALAAPSTDGISMVYIDAFSGSSVNTLRMDTGMRIDMARSAIGRAYLAGVDEVIRQHHLDALAQVHGNDWPELATRVEDAHKEVLNDGFCLVDGEWMSKARAVAVPVIADAQGTVMALSCGAPSFAVSKDRLENELGPQLVHVAKSLQTLVAAEGHV
uniref:IclR family transcriptional regulator n=1 Tax=Marinobacterium profundum TaxID=1714300 RepID=UPI00082AE44C|nr:IclR family transcriptional regulator [Marinobacterium profundum]